MRLKPGKHSHKGAALSSHIEYRRRKTQGYEVQYEIGAEQAAAKAGLS